LAGIAIVVLALAIVWVLFVPLADWLARHDVGPVKGALHETSVDNARGRLLTLGAGLFAAGALVFTARSSPGSRGAPWVCACETSVSSRVSCAVVAYRAAPGRMSTLRPSS
jgi:hypothetical protein